MDFLAYNETVFFLHERTLTNNLRCCLDLMVFLGAKEKPVGVFFYQLTIDLTSSGKMKLSFSGKIVQGKFSELKLCCLIGHMPKTGVASKYISWHDGGHPEVSGDVCGAHYQPPPERHQLHQIQILSHYYRLLECPLRSTPYRFIPGCLFLQFIIYISEVCMRLRT